MGLVNFDLEDLLMRPAGDARSFGRIVWAPFFRATRRIPLQAPVAWTAPEKLDAARAVKGSAPRRTGILLLALLSGPAGSLASERSCPALLAQAKRLVLITAPTMDTSAATARLFERASPDAPWRPAHGLEPAVVGLAGMGWGSGFRDLARDREPIKTEGDRRTPAGVFRIGTSFGFAPSSRPNYLRLRAGETVCVDDPSSPAYNTITSRAAVGPKVHGEDMRAVDLYRRGLVVEYPTDAAARAGSCIFVHVWRDSRRGTAGCVAFPEARVAALQDFAENGAVLAVLPRSALDRMPGCLPDTDRRAPQ